VNCSISLHDVDAVIDDWETAPSLLFVAAAEVYVCVCVCVCVFVCVCACLCVCVRVCV